MCVCVYETGVYNIHDHADDYVLLGVVDVFHGNHVIYIYIYLSVCCVCDVIGLGFCVLLCGHAGVCVCVCVCVCKRVCVCVFDVCVWNIYIYI